MRTLLATLALVAATAATPAAAQVQVNVALPTVTFQVPPPLVVVQPGVQVVEDSDDEVYFVNEWYWVRRDGRWFRMKGHMGKWVLVEDALVPRSVIVLPAGKYRRYKGNKATVVINPPGPGKVKVKVKKGKHDKHEREND